MKFSIQKYSEELLRTEKRSGRLRERRDTCFLVLAVGLKCLVEVEMGSQYWEEGDYGKPKPVVDGPRIRG